MKAFVKIMPLLRMTLQCPPVLSSAFHVLQGAVPSSPWEDIQAGSSLCPALFGNALDPLFLLTLTPRSYNQNLLDPVALVTGPPVLWLACRRIWLSPPCFWTPPHLQKSGRMGNQGNWELTVSWRHWTCFMFTLMCVNYVFKLFPQLLFLSQCYESENFQMLFPYRQSIGSRCLPLIL